MRNFTAYTPVILINETFSGFELGRPGVYTVELNIFSESWMKESQILNELLKMRAPYLLTLVNHTGAESRGLPAALFDLIEIFLMGVSYERKNEQPVIGVRGIDINSEIIKSLTGRLRSQGFPEIRVLNFVDQKFYQTHLDNSSHLTISDAEVINFFSGGISAIARILNQYVYFRTDSMRNSLGLEVELNRRIVLFLSENKDYDLLIKRLIQTENQLEKAEDKFGVQTRKLAIAESFVEVAKSKYKDDYESLFAYYHKEYEVLPLWFKRVGHIIKVLTGHRKFNSLIGRNLEKINKSKEK